MRNDIPHQSLESGLETSPQYQAGIHGRGNERPELQRLQTKTGLRIIRDKACLSTDEAMLKSFIRTRDVSMILSQEVFLERGAL